MRSKQGKGEALLGLKVADFSIAIAGPMTTRYLADHGATVVKIEHNNRPDPARTTPPYRDNLPGLNRGTHFANINLNKYGITLDLHHPKGLEMARKILMWADVMVESFTPGVLRRLGLSYEDVQKTNPAIIVLSTTGWGQTGPYAKFPSYGYILSAAAGIANTTGWTDKDPVAEYGPYPDFIAPRFQVAALMAALDYRRRTGKGLHIDSSQFEALVQYMSPLILDYETNNREPRRAGNRCHHAAPHGVYRCQGDDRWCAISVESDEEWERFTQAIGEPEWSGGSQFTTILGRKQNEDELNSLVEKWTVNYTAKEVVAVMQKAGIAAGIVHDAEGLCNDPQLAYYHHFERLEHPEIGTFDAQRLGFTLSKTPGQLQRPGPCVGEHNEYVCTKLLGMPDKEFLCMLDEGAFG